MQNNRLILWAVFGLLAFMIFSKWQTANLPPVPQTTETAQVSANSSTTANSSVPTIGTSNMPSSVGSTQIDATKTITVTTDVLSVELSPMGGDIISVELLKYSESLEAKDQPFELLSSSNNRLFVSQTGLAGPKDNQQANFSHEVGPFVASEASYQLVDGQESLVVPLTYTDATTGSVLTKTYTFTKGRYDVGFEQTITNHSSTPWVGGSYVALVQKDPMISGHLMGASSYTGPVFSMGEEAYTKVPFDKTSNEGVVVNGTQGWGAMIQQYFTSAWLSLNDRPTAVKVAKDPNINGAAFVLLNDTQGVTVQPGAAHSFANKLYIGPKIKQDLVNAGEYTYVNGKGEQEKGNAKLELTLDYGWFSPISALMLWVLEFFHGIVGNWGWSIVLLTFAVKLLLYPFSEKGYRSMAKMRHLAPEMQRLKELYGSDRQKIGQETLALYRKEKVNPMGGCWPMLIQIPIFIALFWMLQESVQLRQAPWILWIHDLAIMDPYFVLPIIMCATMFVQQMFNPPPPDPMQAKIMKFMPLVFGFMFLWFASGIVLYWIVNNLLTILQQWLINRRIAAAEKKAKA